jgi:hypothetical protein
MYTAGLCFKIDGDGGSGRSIADSRRENVDCGGEVLGFLAGGGGGVDGETAGWGRFGGWLWNRRYCSSKSLDMSMLRDASWISWLAKSAHLSFLISGLALAAGAEEVVVGAGEM